MKRSRLYFLAALLVTALTLAAMIAATSVSSFAADQTSGNFTYSVKDNKATITGFNTSYEGKVTIPSKLGGYTVETIGEGAFRNCKLITGVTIPSSVKTIRRFAFADCQSLKAITIPDTVTELENYSEYSYGMFEGCTDLETAVIGNGVKIGSGVSVEPKAMIDSDMGGEK